MGGDATEKRIGETGTHRDRILAGEGVIVLERREAHREENGARRVFGSITPRGDASTGRRAREEWQTAKRQASRGLRPNIDYERGTRQPRAGKRTRVEAACVVSGIDDATSRVTSRNEVALRATTTLYIITSRCFPRVGRRTSRVPSATSPPAVPASTLERPSCRVRLASVRLPPSRIHRHRVPATRARTRRVEAAPTSFDVPPRLHASSPTSSNSWGRLVPPLRT